MSASPWRNKKNKLKLFGDALKSGWIRPSTIILLMIALSAKSVLAIECPASMTSSCESCDSNEACLDCKDNYFLKDGSCYKCGRGCITCTEMKTCTICETGWYLTKENRCAPCDSSCTACFGDRQTCSACIEGYWLDHNGNCYNRWSLLIVIVTLIGLTALVGTMMLLNRKMAAKNRLPALLREPLYPESVLGSDAGTIISPVPIIAEHIGKHPEYADVSEVILTAESASLPQSSSLDIRRNFLQYLDSQQDHEDNCKPKGITNFYKRIVK